MRGLPRQELKMEWDRVIMRNTEELLLKKGKSTVSEVVNKLRAETLSNEKLRTSPNLT